MYKGFVEHYGVITIEDPYEQDDWGNWKDITTEMGVRGGAGDCGGPRGTWGLCWGPRQPAVCIAVCCAHCSLLRA